MKEERYQPTKEERAAEKELQRFVCSHTRTTSEYIQSAGSARRYAIVVCRDCGQSRIITPTTGGE